MHSYYYYHYLLQKKPLRLRSSINSDADRMDTFSSVEYDQRVNQHHQQLDYGVETNDTALFDNIINSYEKADNELGGTIIVVN